MRTGSAMKSAGWLLAITCLSTMAGAQGLECNFDGYKPVEGLRAGMNRGNLEMTWQGEGGQELRAVFTVRDGQPIIQQLAARSSDTWNVLGADLTPEFQVTTG